MRRDADIDFMLKYWSNLYKYNLNVKISTAAVETSWLQMKCNFRERVLVDLNNFFC